LIAARIGQGICGLAAVIGLINGHIMLMVIAVFIAFAAEAELQVSRRRSTSTSSSDGLATSAELMGDIQRKLDNLR